MDLRSLGGTGGTDRSDLRGSERGAPSIRRAGEWRPLVISSEAAGELLVADAPGEVAAVLDRVEEWASRGGVAAGYVSYESAPAFDSALRVRARPDHDPPLAWFRLLEQADRRDSLRTAGLAVRPAWGLDTSRHDYAESVRAIRRAIGAGDTYQVNFTIRVEAAFSGKPSDLFAELWYAQPVPHAAFLDLGRWAVCSLSPELFFDLDGDRIVSRPMKGTARRGLWPAGDREIALRLRASEKERAENLMIVDMVRNDLGRVARPGSVVTRSLFDLERYASVWQLTSSVEARTDASLAEIFGALFPSASITGAPKVRATGIIADLETSPRGIYCGAVGTVGPGRRARFNVAIRTVVVDREDGRARYGVGGGIVWDSTPEAEYQECRDKAIVLVEAPASFELLETMLWRGGRGIWLWDEHLDRLTSSADHFDFPAPDPPELRAAIARAVEGPSDQSRIVRLRWSRGGELALELTPLGTAPPGPVRAGWARTPVDPADVRLYHKTTDRDLYDRALREAGSADEAILRNVEGFVTELSVGNLVVETGAGELLTPPLEHGLIPGVYRRHLLERGVIREAPLTPSDVADAAAVWRINSVRGWTRLVVEPGS